MKTTYTWDALDRKTSERNDIPNDHWTLVEWTYTPVGKKKTVAVSKDRKRLQETKYSYDQLGRYTAIHVDGKQKVWYDYHRQDLRLKQKRFWNGWVIDYQHYPTGHPQSLVAKDGDGKIIKDVSYVWTPAGKLKSRLLDGIHHAYSYDHLGRLTEVRKTKPSEPKAN